MTLLNITRVKANCYVFSFIQNALFMYTRFTLRKCEPFIRKSYSIELVSQITGHRKLKYQVDTKLPPHKLYEMKHSNN